MNILWLSVPPFAPTGYGTQTAQAVRRLKRAGHNVAVSAMTGLRWTEIEWEGVTVYPSDGALNKKTLKTHVHKWAAECGCPAGDVQVISLYDVWAWADPSPQYGGAVADFHGLRLASWVPVDSLPVMPKTLAALAEFDIRPIAMSRFGEQALKDAGLDPLYVPHGIDTSVYKPHQDRGACKEMLGIPKDRFVVGMVAHNEGMQPSRKAFPQVFQAFSAFHNEHPDSVLYLHTEPTGRVFNGLNLVGLAQHFGVPQDAVVPVRQQTYLSGDIAPNVMSAIYSAMDVLASPSYGEGFGLPIVEAQACGTPVVVSHWTAMPELVGSGWTVGGQPWFNESSGGFWWHADWQEVQTAFGNAYERRDDQEFRDLAREFALRYDADRVFEEHWEPALEALARPLEAAPLRSLPNREARRRARKSPDAPSVTGAVRAHGGGPWPGGSPPPTSKAAA